VKGGNGLRLGLGERGYVRVGRKGLRLGLGERGIVGGR